jgi:cell division protein ZapE
MTPLQRYRADLEREGFCADEQQQRTVVALQALYERLRTPHDPRAVWRRFWFVRPLPVKGIYLWGGTGRGKTYLMDCFFDSLTLVEKRRVHFHRFMLEVHEALGCMTRVADPLQAVARQLAARYRVLCVDEFHVTDVADAMLLAGLLNGLFGQRVVLVATSNTALDDLYRDGLQRKRFLPAVELLRTHTVEVELEGVRDFRFGHSCHSGSYRVINGARSEEWLRTRLQELVTSHPRAGTALSIAGRTVQARAVADGVAWFEFAELCSRPRSASDYLELAGEFHTLLLQDVPGLNEEMDDAVRRFIHLIDALYDHGVKLVVTAAAFPDQLYAGRRLRQAFQRTVSRLTEMSGTAYLARAHRSDR